MKRDLPIAAGCAALLLHLLGNAHYGFFRDELYFIICGRHPAFGYVDQPPLIPWLAAASQLFGHSLFMLRLFPALAAAGLVYICASFTAELGGNRFAQALAALCTTLGSDLLLNGVLFSTDTFQPLAWMLILISVYRFAAGTQTAHTRYLLAAALGVGALSKYSIAIFCMMLLLALLASPQRRVLRLPALWLGVAIGVAVGMPSVLWQAAHGFPFLELIRNGSHGKNVVLGQGEFLIAQLKMLNPFYAPIWLSGLWLLLRSKELRWIGLTYILLYIYFLLLHGKDYYLMPIYPVLFVAGALQISRWAEPSQWARSIIASTSAAAGFFLLPICLPVLPIDNFIAYEKALHITPTFGENQKLGPLPQYWADMFGWPELADDMAKVYATLSPEEKARAYILVDNYGEASAINFFGPALGLPAAISGHNAYSTWGPGPNLGADLMIDMNATVEDDAKFCSDARLGGVHHSNYAMPYESNLGIVVCRGAHEPLSKIFPKQRHIN